MAFKIPANVAELDDAALKKSHEDGLAAVKELAAIDDDKITDEQLAEFEAINAFLTEASAEAGVREEKVAARAAKIAELRSAVPAEDDDEGEGDEEAGEGDDSGEEKTNEDEAPAEGAEAATENEEPVAVAASGQKKSAASRAAKAAPKPKLPAPGGGISMVAAADVPGVPSGEKFSSLTDAAKAISARLEAYPSSPNGQRFKNRAGAVLFNMSRENKLRQDNFRNDTEMLFAASQEAALDGGSLVAAGGWGAPSEQVLDFCSIETADGLFDLSEVTLTRGGISYTKGPSFEDVMNSATGFWDMTEATAEAGTELKTSLRPEVPDFIEARLDAVGVMVEAGLLTRAAWPELVERYAAMALLAHQMKMSAKALAGVRGFTGPAVNISGGFGSELDILNVLALVAHGERTRFAMARNATLEVLLADWVKEAVRAGLANRNGVDFLSVTDAQIEQWFSSRKLRVQWLRGFQDLEIDTTAGVAINYPDTVEAIMYPAGTYVKGVTDVLKLDTVYDSTNLKKNDYVHLFVEQGLVVTNPCNEGRRLEVPLHINGRTAANDVVVDAFRAAADTGV